MTPQIEHSQSGSSFKGSRVFIPKLIPRKECAFISLEDAVRLVGFVSLSRSSSREVRIRVPFFLQSILVGESSQPKKVGKMGS